MDLFEKIQKIRQKPEHIRMRYVWTMVTLSMVFVLIVWAVSLKEDQKKDVEIMNAIKNSEIANQLKEQKDSLKNTTESISNTLRNQGQSEILNNK